ncbi:MAG: photosynthetic complex putative assembly protein PuhB [Oceanicaulis sp.]
MCDPDKIKPEPIPGLPEELPKGERLLWQGAPEWKSLAMHVFHVRAVAIYFTVIAIWKAWASLAAGAGAATAALDVVSVALLAVATLGLLSLLAWLIARSTIYSVTSERVVIRAGVALPKAVNIPFKVVGSAALKVRKGGDGDIPLQLTGPDRAAYVQLWPHVRPWRVLHAQPMLRGVPDAAKAAEILGAALAEKAGQPARKIAVETETPGRQAAAMGGGAALANS